MPSFESRFEAPIENLRAQSRNLATWCEYDIDSRVSLRPPHRRTRSNHLHSPPCLAACILSDIATLPFCSIYQTFEKLTWGVQRSLWSSRTSRLVSFKTATRLPCADMYHTDVGQGEKKTAYHTCFVLPRRRRTSKSRNRTRCPIKDISLTQITKMTTRLLPHIKSTSARHEKGVKKAKLYQSIMVQ